MSRRRYTIRATALLVPLLWLAIGPPAAAQVVFQPRHPSDNQLSDDVFPPAPRELRQRLKYAREALDEGRYTESSALLGNLVAGRLEESDNQDYFIASDDEPGLMLSIKAEAQRMIGTMPAAGREVYELQFGAEAQQMLNEALASGDAQRLAEVTRLFFHTRAGYEANLLLGRYYLNRGKPLAAALTLQNLEKYPAALSQFDPDLSLLLATCWMLADMPERARDTLTSLQRRRPRAELHVQGEARGLPAGDADLLAWLEQQIGGRPELARSTTKGWAMHRGDPTRNGATDGGAPIHHPRWVATLNTQASEERLISKIQDEDFIAQQLAPLPAIQPLAVGDTIMVRTPSYLMGISFRTGKRVWTFPWEEADDWEQAALGGAGPAIQGVEQRRAQLQQRLFHDAPYGQVASDGKSVFMIDDLGFAAIAGRSHFIRRGGVREQNPFWPSDFNQLMALDIEREGALKWTVGGQSGEDEPQLAGAFFLGPPLPLMGQLFVMAEINGEIRLVALDAETGRYEWSQQLAVVGQQTINNDLVRRLAGASPSFADGVLICPTSAGAVVAVDVSTRTLMWGFTYSDRTPATVNAWQQQQRAGTPAAEDTWADATVTIAAGRVIMTPRDSGKLYCLDLLTGKSLWQAKPRDDLVYLACVHDGLGVFVGNSRVTALRLDDGAPAWKDDIPLEALPSGRGFYSGDHYFLPTTAAQLLKIDLNTGELVRSFDTEHTLGNVICYGDQLISLTPHRLESYYLAEPLRERVASRLRENPDDPAALAQQAELLLQEGDQDGALESLRRAWQLDSENARIERLLAKSVLNALRTDFDAYHELALEMEPLLDDDAGRAEYLRLMAAGWRQTGRAEQAFAAYMALAGETPTDVSGNNMEEVERLHSVRRDRWIQAQLAALLRDADPQQRQALEAEIDRRLEQALKTDSLESLRHANGLFGFLPQTEQLRLRMAQHLLDSNAQLAAEVMLTHLQQADDEAIALTAGLKLADLLEQAGRLGEAARQFDLLAERYGGQADDEHSATVARLAEAFAERHRETALIGAAGNWPNGRATATLENTRTAQRPSYQRVYPITPRRQSGPSPLGMQVAFDQQRNDILVTSGWGRELQRASLNRPDNRRFYLSNYNVTSYDALGHLIVASIGSEIVAIDTLAPLRSAEGDDAAVLWRQDSYHAGESRTTNVRLQSNALDNPWGTARYVAADNYGRRVGVYGPITRRGVCVHRSREVVCLDPLSGEQIWSRRDIDPGSDLFGDQEHLFVVPPKGGVARVLSMVDGSEVAQRPVPPESQRWLALDGRLLCWERSESVEKDDQLSIYLLDALTGEELWRRAYPMGTRAALMEPDEIALLTAEGALEIVRLADGAVKTRQQVELDAALMSLHVIRSSQEYLLAASLQRQRAPANDMNIQPAPSGLYAPLLDGKIWCVDRASGKLRWQSAADIDRFGLPLDQPTETPVLALLRQVTSVSRNGTRRAHCSVLLLDKRDGRQLFAADEISTMAYTYGLIGDPENRRVTLELPGFEVRVDYSDEPRPPQPPVQMSLSANRPTGLSGTLGGMFSAVGRAVEQVGEREVAPPAPARAVIVGRERNVPNVDVDAPNIPPP